MRALHTETRTIRSAFSGEFPFPAFRRPTIVGIDLDALAHNYREVVRHADGRKILAVVKAQAYGHGARSISEALVALGADMLGVALVEEGIDLRQAGITAPILVMGVFFPEQADAIIDHDLTPVIFSRSIADALTAAVQKRGTHVSAHVKIDTGMGRIGLLPDEAPDFITGLTREGSITVSGLMTHLADADLRDKTFTSEQLRRFHAVIRELEKRGIVVPMLHTANSSALMDYLPSLFTMVRPGLMLYGYNPLEGRVRKADIQPVLSLITKIAYLKRVPPGVPISYGRTFVTKRESLIATLPIGYADGYSRKLSNTGEALVRGVRVPLVGRVCMDMCMADVTGVPGVQEGDEVILIGRQGNEHITADDIADKIGTIPYEVLCGISDRVPRIYL
ncbi:MAG: alanine racemase [Nitrospirota bacterium]